MSRILVVALVMTAPVARADDKKYALADLKTLVGEKAFQEAFVHLGDIAPSQRTADWIDLAATASAGVLATLPTDDGSTLVMIDGIDREYPQLLKAAKYTAVRAELGVKGLAGCFRATRRGDCLRLATRLVDGSADRKLALDVAKLTVTHANAADAVPMFARALDPKATKLVCGDDQLRRAVIGGLDRAPASTTATEAKSLMTTCWDTVKDAVAKAFDEASKGSDVHKNTCDTLKAKRMLSPLQAKRCK